MGEKGILSYEGHHEPRASCGERENYLLTPLHEELAGHVDVGGLLGEALAAVFDQ